MTLKPCPRWFTVLFAIFAVFNAWGQPREEYDNTLGEPAMIELLRLKPKTSVLAGKLEKISGSSSVSRAGGGKVDLPAFDQKIFENDFLVTGPEGRMRFYSKAGTWFELGAKTRLSVERLRESPKLWESRVRFVEGLVRVIHGGPPALLSDAVSTAHVSANTAVVPDQPVKPQRLLIKTLGAMLVVTDNADFFLFQEINEKDLNIRVLSGTVRATGMITNEVVTVSSGMGALLRSTGIIADVRTVPNEVFESYKSKTRQ
jgi:hypothetical protein